MPSTTPHTPGRNHYTAAEILRSGANEQIDLFYESLEGLDPNAAAEVSRRTAAAIERGYLRVDLNEGLFRLTRKGSEYLAAQGPCPCRRCMIHDDPGGCLYR